MFDIALQIFFLLNPLTAIPILLLAYEKGFNVKFVALKATLLAFLTAIAFVFLGPLLFSIFKITIDSFRAAGGIIIMLLGISMARGFESEKVSSNISHIDAIISLLATPVLTGPATLSYLAVKTHEFGMIALIMAIALAFFMLSAVLFFFVSLIPNINLKYINFVSRIFGLILVALGIEMFSKGIKVLIF
jgi:multiple antibiotic resistance protein